MTTRVVGSGWLLLLALICGDGGTLAESSPYEAAQPTEVFEFAHCIHPKTKEIIVNNCIAEMYAADPSNPRICAPCGCIGEWQLVVPPPESADQSDPWSDWSPWSLCSCSCDGGVRTRIWTAESTAGMNAGSAQEEACNQEQCPTLDVRVLGSGIVNREIDEQFDVAVVLHGDTDAKNRSVFLSVGHGTEVHMHIEPGSSVQVPIPLHKVSVGRHEVLASFSKASRSHGCDISARAEVLVKTRMKTWTESEFVPGLPQLNVWGTIPPPRLPKRGQLFGSGVLAKPDFFSFSVHDCSCLHPSVSRVAAASVLG